MNKKILIIIICVGVVALAITYFVISNLSAGKLVQQASFKGAEQKKQSGSRVVITTPSGDVSIKNIFTKKNTSYTKEGDPDKVTIAGNSNFSFEYRFGGDQFVVKLLSQPVKDSRTEAENSVLQSLDINKEDACKLNLFLYIPTAVDKNLGADEQSSYGLSWCPGAYTF